MQEHREYLCCHRHIGKCVKQESDVRKMDATLLHVIRWLTYW